MGTVRVSGVSGGGWKGEAVRRGVKTSDEDDAVDQVGVGVEDMALGTLGSVRRR